MTDLHGQTLRNAVRELATGYCEGLEGDDGPDRYALLLWAGLQLLTVACAMITAGLHLPRQCAGQAAKDTAQRLKRLAEERN